MANRDTSVSELCMEMGIKPVTLYRYVGSEGPPGGTRIALPTPAMPSARLALGGERVGASLCCAHRLRTRVKPQAPPDQD